VTADVVVVNPLERARMQGDARPLGPADRVALLRQLVDEASLAWGASPPIIFITAEGGRLVPYLTKAGADALAASRGASITGLELVDRVARRTIDVTASASMPDGRTNVDVGSCEYDPKQPKSYGRARQVATTRARRRVILGLLGSGFSWIEQGERELGLEDDPEPQL
jgi:hypothetical protein